MNNLVNAIMPLVIVIGSFFLLFAMIKYEGARPYLGIVFSIVIIVSGVYSGMTMYNYYTARSTVNGTMNESVQPYDNLDIFNHSLIDPVFYKSGDNYYLSQVYNKHEEFDGTDKNYTMFINNSPCETTLTAAGRIYAKTSLVILSVDGNDMQSFDFKINVTFFGTEKILFEIDTNATDSNINYLNQYVLVSGINIRIVENAYPYSSSQSYNNTFAVKFYYTNAGEGDNYTYLTTINTGYFGYLPSNWYSQLSSVVPEGYFATYYLDPECSNLVSPGNYIITEDISIYMIIAEEDNVIGGVLPPEGYYEEFYPTSEV